MSKQHLTLEVITTQGQAYFSEDIDKLIIPGKHGLITVLPGHIDIAATLKAGEVIVYCLNSEKVCERLKINDGFLQIVDNSLVTILTGNMEKLPLE